jgi:hypothetical protein
MITYHYNGEQITLKHGTDSNPTCPNCQRFNAMLFERMCNGPSDDYVLKCRDCGAEVIVLTTMKQTTMTSTFIELNGV